MIILGIESSCDETGLAIFCTDRGLLANALFSQVDLHALYGGVVPELASRDHIRRLVPLTRQVCEQAGIKLASLDGVAYTAGPGLAGALLTGAMMARGLAWALECPALGVHHLEGHVLAPMLEPKAPAFPFVCLLVSGGHTQLIHVAALGDYRLLGDSVDDAAGEAFDKTAKMLGLPYPGGAALSRLAESGDASAVSLPRPMLDRPDLDFSFSGLKTAAITRYKAYLKTTQEVRPAHADEGVQGTQGTQGVQGTQGTQGVQDTQDTQDTSGAHDPLRKTYSDLARFSADLAASFEQAVVDVLIGKSRRALERTGLTRLVISGGVSANRRLRSAADALQADGYQVFYPRLEYCTDNGAMIALAGALRLQQGESTGLSVSIRPRWPLESLFTV